MTEQEQQRRGNVIGLTQPFQGDGLLEAGHIQARRFVGSAGAALQEGRLDGAWRHDRGGQRGKSPAAQSVSRYLVG